MSTDTARVKFDIQDIRYQTKTSHGSHASALSSELKSKVIDAVSIDKSYPKTQKEIRNAYLMNTVKIKPSSKPHSKNAVFTPLMQYMKDTKPIVAKKKISSKRGSGVKTQYYSYGGHSSMGNHSKHSHDHTSNTLK